MLALLPADKVIAGVITWMGRIAYSPILTTSLAILDCVPDKSMDALADSLHCAPETNEGGGWDDGIPPTLDELKKMETELAKMEGAGDD